MKRILIIAITITLILIAPLSVSAAEITNYDAIIEIYELLKNDHLSNIDDASLEKGAIKGMIEALGDPHTRYFTEEEYRQFIEDLDGDFVGIGVYISEESEYIRVQSVIKGSPAEAAGLQGLDLIISVDGTDLKGKSTEETSSLIRGEAGTNVLLKIKRGEKMFDLTIKRAQIHIPAVDSEMLDNKIGYLQINSFSSSVDSEAAAELTKLKDQGMEKLIIDVRNNPGGYLNAVLNLCTKFIKQGSIVHVRDNESNESTYSISNGTDWQLPTVLLINSGSASASEIFAGALKEYNVATIVGTKTFGKGTVQHLLTLKNGGHLKLTVNEYYTSKKAKVDGVGIAPDIGIADEAKQLEFAKLYLTNLNTLKRYVVSNPANVGDANGFDSYIALRDLSRAFGASIYWDAAKRVVAFRLGTDRVEFSEKNEGLLIKNGVSYLPLEQLNKLVPGLIVVKEGGKTTIYRK